MRCASTRRPRSTPSSARSTRAWWARSTTSWVRSAREGSERVPRRSRGPPARARPRRRRLQRRGGLVAAGQGGPRTLGRAGALRHRPVPVVGRQRGRTTAGLWPASGTCAGSVSPPTRWTTRPMWPTGPTAAPTARRALMTVLGPLAADESGHRGAGGERERPGRPPTRTGGGGRGRRRLSSRRGRVHQGGHPRWSRRLGLRTWDKPAAACLASRLPYGTPVTLGRLRRRAGGGGVRALGFGQLRVRHHGEAAWIEVEADELALVVSAGPMSSPRFGRPDSASSPSTWKASGRAV